MSGLEAKRPLHPSLSPRTTKFVAAARGDLMLPLRGGFEIVSRNGEVTVVAPS